MYLFCCCFSWTDLLTQEYKYSPLFFLLQEHKSCFTTWYILHKINTSAGSTLHTTEPSPWLWACRSAVMTLLSSRCPRVCVRLNFQKIWSQESYLALLEMLEMCRPFLRSQVSSVFRLEFFLSQRLWRWYPLSRFFIRTSSRAQNSVGMMWHFLESFHSACLSRSCHKKCWL